MLVEICANDQ